MKSQKVLYLCNGEKECCTKPGCYKNEPNYKCSCRHTADVQYAKNFTKENSGTAGLFVESNLYEKNERVVLLDALKSYINSLREFGYSDEQIREAIRSTTFEAIYGSHPDDPGPVGDPGCPGPFHRRERNL